MLGKKKFTVLLLIIGLAFSVPLFADALILKSGKKIEGKVVEKTDAYVKIEIRGVTLKYYRDEIMSVEVDTSGFPLERTKIPSETDSDDVEWGTWFLEVKDYLIRVNQMLIDGGRLQNEASLKIQGAEIRRQKRELKHILRDIKRRLSDIRLKLLKIKPPGELERYHKSAKDALTYTIKFVDAALIGDKVASSQHVRNVLRASKEGLEEQKRLFLKHNAPQQLIDSTERDLKKVNALLGYNFM
ncbi:MAG: hypothetical protein JSW40_08205 [Candidatus Omnitrophota bacterium]|nr:MAG: hypothetical protein JSW40_08205 [Candidatus Omnitrophota bacterium]